MFLETRYNQLGSGGMNVKLSISKKTALREKKGKEPGGGNLQKKRTHERNERSEGSERTVPALIASLTVIASGETGLGGEKIQNLVEPRHSGICLGKKEESPLKRNSR